jgi:hypothetical protein
MFCLSKLGITCAYKYWKIHHREGKAMTMYMMIYQWGVPNYYCYPDNGLKLFNSLYWDNFAFNEDNRERVSLAIYGL